MQRKDSSSNEGDLKKKTSDIDYVMDDDQRLPVAGDGCASSLPGTAHSSKTNSCSSSITSLPSPASIRARRASGTSNSILATQSYEEEKAVDSLEDRFPFLKDDRKRTRKLLSPEQTRILEAILERVCSPTIDPFIRKLIWHNLSLREDRLPIDSVARGSCSSAWRLATKSTNLVPK